MKVHLGFLAEKPHEDRDWLWISRRSWNSKHFPADVRHKLGVWLHTPGFSDKFHADALDVSQVTIRFTRKNIGPFEDFKAEALENFMSVTDEDARKLWKMRAPRSSIPSIVQLRMLDMYKRGMTQAEICRFFGAPNSRQIWVTLKRGYAISPKPVPVELQHVVRYTDPLNLNPYLNQ